MRSSLLFLVCNPLSWNMIKSTWKRKKVKLAVVAWQVWTDLVFWLAVTSCSIYSRYLIYCLVCPGWSPYLVRAKALGKYGSTRMLLIGAVMIFAYVDLGNWFHVSGGSMPAGSWKYWINPYSLLAIPFYVNLALDVWNNRSKISYPCTPNP